MPENTGAEKKEGITMRANILRLAAGAATMVIAALLPAEPAWLQPLLFLAAYFILGYKVLWEALCNIRHGEVFDENFLMCIASIGAFLLQEYLEAVAVMLFYQIGELFEDYAVDRSRRNITDLMDIRPDTAHRKTENGLETVHPEAVAVGETIVIEPGERVPLDGVVTEGTSALDTAALTGESMPRTVTVGDEILSGCINGGGLLTVQVQKVFGESTVARILDMVENASMRKAKTETFITRFAHIYTPVVVAAAAVLAILPPLLIPGAAFRDWVYRALEFLIVSCPCALVISVPLSFFGGIGAASRSGVLVKGSNYLEAIGGASCVVMDKTGTLTKGVFEVEDVQPADGFSAHAVLEAAALAESFSTHPIAQSLRRAFTAWEKPDGAAADGPCAPAAAVPAGAEKSAAADGASDMAAREGAAGFAPAEAAVQDAARAVTAGGMPADAAPAVTAAGMFADAAPGDAAARVTDVKEVAGRGVTARIDGHRVAAGSLRLMEEAGAVSVDTGGGKAAEIGETDASGATLVYVAIDGTYAGCIRIADQLKPDAAETVAALKRRGIETVMLTGDSQTSARAVAARLDIDRAYGDLLPGDKVAKVEDILAEKPPKGHVVFVGDGINDAPVLARADVGVAMGALGSDAAIEAADIVIMDDAPSKLTLVMDIAKKTMGIARENIVFAICVKILVLILCAIGYADMWAAVFADVGVSVLAICNALRALRVRRRA